MSFEHLSHEDFVDFSVFRQEVKVYLVEVYKFTEEDAIRGIYTYRNVFPKLQARTEPREVASKIRNNPYIGGATEYEEYLAIMNEAFTFLVESKKMPEIKNKAAEICPSCKLVKYIDEACTFCGSNGKGLQVTR
ncbi:hypothetical protein ACYEXS_32015 [Paenibacillus sp. MAH-36]|uniref:Uncharacterized protein n=1 Tax=Paenibacillus violae TaxID=3077234 RepID=A0ABU3RRH8_9BACL|nr:hypothetical protein [Paenibacillus sp. PFR10]MDU0206472.1 hypothetical protein [Paenibacillus sp. PFR10]